MLGWISGARTGPDALAQRPAVSPARGCIQHRAGPVKSVSPLISASRRGSTSSVSAEFHAATVVARAAWRRQAADLAGLQAQAAGVEGGAERQLRAAAASQLISRRWRPCPASSEAQPGPAGLPLAWKTVAVTMRLVRGGGGTDRARRRGRRGQGRCRSSRKLDAGEARAQPRHQAADHAGADHHRYGRAQRGAPSQQALIAVSRLAASTRARPARRRGGTTAPAGTT